jgi:hypothetical protein
MTANPSRFPINEAIERLHADLGYQKLNKLWAKAEIVLGLLAAGVGLFIGVWAATRTPEIGLEFAGVGLLLFVLGGYLALAGSRSHLYQSNNRLAAYLAESIRQNMMSEKSLPESRNETGR